MRETTGAILAVCALTASAAPSTAHAAEVAPIPRCATSQLRLTSVPDDGGLGHQSEAIFFRNDGGPCTLRGYPTVRLLDREGRVVSVPQRTALGYQAGVHGQSPPLVRLATGGVANARIEGLTGPADGRACPRYVAYQVTAPGAAIAVRVLAHESVCVREIHPIVPGRAAFYPPQTP